MTEPPDNLTKYQIEQLFSDLGGLRAEMREGFAEIKRLLDARLESRDKEMKALDDRVSELEKWRARLGGQLVLLGAVGGVIVTIGIQRLFS